MYIDSNLGADARRPRPDLEIIDLKKRFLAYNVLKNNCNIDLISIYFPESASFPRWKNNDNYTSCRMGTGLVKGRFPPATYHKNFIQEYNFSMHVKHPQLVICRPKISEQKIHWCKFCRCVFNRIFREKKFGNFLRIRCTYLWELTERESLWSSSNSNAELARPGGWKSSVCQLPTVPSGAW